FYDVFDGKFDEEYPNLSKQRLYQNLQQKLDKFLIKIRNYKPTKDLKINESKNGTYYIMFNFYFLSLIDFMLDRIEKDKKYYLNLKKLSKEIIEKNPRFLSKQWKQSVQKNKELSKLFFTKGTV